MNPHLSYKDILALIDDFDPIKYTKTRNHLRGAVSKLSPYITRGVISLPAIRAQVLKKHPAHNAQKFIQELAWREYFQKVFSAKGEEIFSDLRFSRDDWQHHEVVTAIKSASTGITVIDEKLKELMETGYMHNHARMWTAMIACNVGKAYWYDMSRFLYYHLMDGDLASNTLSWQWVAGTSVQKQYVANQDLINNCSDVRQRDTYLDMPIENIGKQDIPLALLTHEPLNFKTKYPVSDEIGDVSGKTVFLYHPWSIDPLWRCNEVGERIFIIEPSLFDKHPVSPRVLEHMLTLLKTHVPNAKLFVGNAETIPGIVAATVISKAHPTTTHISGHKDVVEELFPHVNGYYQSFFKFWEACEGG